jgi:hypothetical protein
MLDARCWMLDFECRFHNETPDYLLSAVGYQLSANKSSG